MASGGTGTGSGTLGGVLTGAGGNGGARSLSRSRSPRYARALAHAAAAGASGAGAAGTKRKSPALIAAVAGVGRIAAAALAAATVEQLPPPLEADPFETAARALALARATDRRNQQQRLQQQQQPHSQPPLRSQRPPLQLHVQPKALPSPSATAAAASTAAPAPAKAIPPPSCAPAASSIGANAAAGVSADLIPCAATVIEADTQQHQHQLGAMAKRQRVEAPPPDTARAYANGSPKGSGSGDSPVPVPPPAAAPAADEQMNGPSAAHPHANALPISVSAERHDPGSGPGPISGPVAVARADSPMSVSSRSPSPLLSPKRTVTMTHAAPAPAPAAAPAPLLVPASAQDLPPTSASASAPAINALLNGIGRSGSGVDSATDHRACGERISALESIVKVWQKKYLTSQNQLLQQRLAAEQNAFRAQFAATASPAAVAAAFAAPLPAPGSSLTTSSANGSGSSGSSGSGGGPVASIGAADAALAAAEAFAAAQPARLFQGLLLCTLDATHPGTRTAMALVPAHSLSAPTAHVVINALDAHALAAPSSRALLTLVLDYALSDYLVICYADGHAVDVYDCASYALWARFPSCLPPHSNRVQSLVAIPDTTLLVGNTLDAVLVWDWTLGTPVHYLPLTSNAAAPAAAYGVPQAMAADSERSRLLYLKAFNSILLITSKRKVGDCFRLYSAKTWRLEYEWQTQVHTFDVVELSDGRIVWASNAASAASGSGAAAAAASASGGADCFGVWSIDTSGVRAAVSSQTMPGPMFEDRSAVELNCLCVLPALNSVLVSYALSPSFAPKERHVERYTFDSTGTSPSTSTGGSSSGTPASLHRLLSVSRAERATGLQTLRKLLPMPDGRVLAFGSRALEVLEWSRPTPASVTTGGATLSVISAVPHDMGDDAHALDALVLSDGRVVACASDSPVKIWR